MYSVSGHGEVERFDSRSAAVARAREVSEQTGRTVEVTTEQIRMVYKRGSLSYLLDHSGDKRRS